MTDSSERDEGIHFTAPWGRSVKLTSTVATIVLMGLPFLALFMDGPRVQSLGWLFLGLPLGILIGCGLFMINGYIVEGGMVYVDRLQWRTPVSLVGLKSVEIVGEAARPTWRVFGNGGLFACVGWFANARLGRYRAFATDFEKSVLLQFPNGKVVVTPGDPDGFVAAVEQEVAVMNHGPGR